MENPFKFGTVVDGEYFADRKEEMLKQVFNRFKIEKNQTLDDTFPLYSLRAYDRMDSGTAIGAVKRLLQAGYVIKNDRCEIDDPFFAESIRKRV